MKWKRKGKQVFAMMLAVATLLSGCAPNGIVFRWGYTCDYTQQGGAGNPFFMRFLSTVLGSSPAEAAVAIRVELQSIQQMCCLSRLASKIWSILPE